MSFGNALGWLAGQAPDTVAVRDGERAGLATAARARAGWRIGSYGFRFRERPSSSMHR